jgi:hypothetical protein
MEPAAFRLAVGASTNCATAFPCEVKCKLVPRSTPYRRVEKVKTRLHVFVTSALGASDWLLDVPTAISPGKMPCLLIGQEVRWVWIR